MESQNLILRKNQEKLGNYFLKKGLSFFLIKEEKVAYQFFKEGLDFITCDCSGWYSELDKPTKDFIEYLFNTNNFNLEFLFSKAYVLCFVDLPLENKFEIALDSIDKYLEIKNDEYGHYIKGKILFRLGKKDLAIDSFLNAKNINNHPRLNYNIGRRLEETNQFGLDLLFDSFLKNPSCPCSLNQFKMFMNKRKRIISLNKNEKNAFLLSFNNKSNNSFIFAFNFVKLYSHDWLSKNDNSLEIIKEFITGLNANSDNIRKHEVYIEKTEGKSEGKFYGHGYPDYEPAHITDNPYYNDALDLDQQSPEFWDSI